LALTLVYVLKGLALAIKEILRSAKARTVDALNEAITIAVNAITDEHALNWFNHCGLFFEPIR